MINTKAEPEQNRGDFLKLTIALLLVIGAMAAFYYYSEHSLLLRVVGLLAVTGLAVAVALQTDQGRDIWGFFKESQVEVRKVVWPTRQETTRITLVIVLMVVLIAVFLWLLDSLLAWFVTWLTEQRG